MSSNKVENPYPLFTDTNGKPLESGYIYVGEPGLDAEFNAVSIYSDPALTIPLAQPVRTSGGYPAISGATIRFYVDGDHSIKVKNKNGELVYSANADNTIISASAFDSRYARQFAYLENEADGSDPTTAKGAIDLTAGTVIQVEERAQGKKGGGLWNVVEASTVTPNGEDIVASVGVPTLALVLRDQDLNTESQFSTNPAKSSGWTELEPSYRSTMKAKAEISVDSDGITNKKKPHKAWNYPRGIKDSAVAGSFMLVDGPDTAEPSTQVTGFDSVDNIGTYPGRDTVALFAQVNSAPSLIETSSTTFTATSVTSSDFVNDFDLIDVGMIIDVNFGSGVN